MTTAAAETTVMVDRVVCPWPGCTGIVKSVGVYLDGRRWYQQEASGDWFPVVDSWPGETVYIDCTKSGVMHQGTHKYSSLDVPLEIRAIIGEVSL